MSDLRIILTGSKFLGVIKCEISVLHATLSLSLRNFHNLYPVVNFFF